MKMRRIRMERRKEKNVRRMDKRGCRVCAKRWHG